MNTQTMDQLHTHIVYPDSDGKPMADNTLQFRWTVKIQGGLDALFRRDPDVFVAGDLLWYPVEGNNKLCTAPDVMVAFAMGMNCRKSTKSMVGPAHGWACVSTCPTTNCKSSGQMDAR
jgi:hypothetical protein